MAAYFDRVIGTDPSPGMIAQARQQTTESNVSFREGKAESSPFLPNGEVDCIVAGQAAHWFDYATLWTELSRLLRPGGTVAFWGYKDPVLVDYPAATRILEKYTYGSDPETLGPYWSQPGRSYVQDKLRVVQPPLKEGWADVQRVEYEPECRGKRSGEGTCFVEKRLKVGEMKAYYRTFSSYHGWKEAHPGVEGREKGGQGDVIDRMVDEIVKAEGGGELVDEEKMVNMEWGSGLVMCRKQS